MSVVLGIDLGTQHLKVSFFDAEAGRVIASESSALDLYQGEHGEAEQQAHWWTNALRDALAKVGRNVRDATRAIGVSGQQHGFVALDSAGEVLAPVKLWCDTSTGAQCEAITEEAGGRDRCIEAAGNPILVGYTASKVRWLHDAHPALYEQLDCILLPHDYLNFYLTGERCMEAGDASGTGFFDVRNRQWSDELLRAIDPTRDLSHCLPQVCVTNQSIGTLRETVASSLGLPSGIPVSLGGGDNMMGAIGTGNVRPGTVTMSLGTSGTVYAYSDAPVVDPKGQIAAFCSSTGGWLPLLCTMNCTVSTELTRTLFDLDIGQFDTLVEQTPRGANGVISVPFYNGERTPDLPRAKAALFGLDSRNMNRESLTRAAIEGATFALRFGIEELLSLGQPTEKIIATGGGARSPIWRQIIADICDAPVAVIHHDEGAALGAALQALAMLDTQSDLDALVQQFVTQDEDRACTPQPSAVAVYNDVYERYQRAVDHVAAIHAGS